MSRKQHIKPLKQQSSVPLTDERLQAYLNGSLTPEQQHEVELLLSAEGMESDAVEGLQEMNTNETQHIVHRINRQLKKDLKHQRKNKRTIKGMEWSWIAVFTVLLLGIVAYLILHLMLKR
jgi:anti-sigma factor RsiW